MIFDNILQIKYRKFRILKLIGYGNRNFLKKYYYYRLQKMI